MMELLSKKKVKKGGGKSKSSLFLRADEARDPSLALAALELAFALVLLAEPARFALRLDVEGLSLASGT